MKRIMPGCAALVLLCGAAAAQDDATRSITQVTDDVYRFDNNFHVSWFAITDEGVVVGDPINQAAAEWLKAQIAERTDQPVRYMILSHSHGDHASGGQVFEDTAEVVAHENAAAHVEAGEVDTAMPDVTFADTHEFSLGGKTFELNYLGEGGHGDDLIATVIRPDDVAVVVDVVNPERLPYQTIPAASIDGYIGQIRAVEALDFETLLPGHSKTGTRADATATIEYLELLRQRVQERLDAGDDLEQIKAAVTMPEYADWGSYEQFIGLNVEGMVGHLSN